MPGAQQAAAMLVVDSSVIVKWFLADAESHVAEALDLLWRHQSGEVMLAAPELAALELINAMAKRRISGPEIEAAACTFENMRLLLVPVVDLALDAAAICHRFSLSAYDSSFAALANRLDVPLVTEDRRLAASGACDARLLGENCSPR